MSSRSKVKKKSAPEIVEHWNSYETSTRDNHVRRLPCRGCGGTTTRHTVRASVTETAHLEVEGGGEIDTDYEIVQCDGCEQLSFREFWCPSNQVAEHLPREEFRRRERLYPPRLEGRPAMADIELPANIAAIYSETYRALCDGSQILAGIGIRAIVEAVCAKQGSKKGTLEQKIDRLVVDGTLSKNDAKTLHRLRDLGNQAAHDVKPSEIPRLVLAIEIVEHLLRQMYLLEGARVREHLPRKRKKAQQAKV